MRFIHSRKRYLTLLGGLVFSLPLMLLVYQAFTMLDAEVQATEKERLGIHYHATLFDLLRHMEGLRTLDAAANDASGELAKAKAALGEADGIDQSLGMMFGVRESWQTVRGNVSAALQHAEGSTAETRRGAYTKAASAVIAFMREAGDGAGLSTAASLDSNILAELATESLPELAEATSALQAELTGITASGRNPAEWTPAETDRLKILANQITLRETRLQETLARGGKAGTALQPAAEIYGATLKPAMVKWQEAMPPLYTGAAATAAMEALQAADAAYPALYQQVLGSLEPLLAAEEDAIRFKKNLVLFASAVAFLGIIGLLDSLYCNLAKTEDAEKAAKFYSEALKEEHAALQLAKKEAEAATVAKADFLANMSHELRTPLNSILGMTRLLLKHKLGDEEQQLASTVYQSSSNLLEIVNDILDFSKIEAGEVKLEHIGFSLGNVMQNVTFTLEHIAHEKDLAFRRDYDKDALPLVLGDPTRLTRIMNNLIGNAIKYTPKGMVEVRATHRVLEENCIIFRCEVTDTGIGIAADKLDSVFQKFVQADTSTTRKFGGTGLGLAITKQLVELMAGGIGVESEVGKGSTFWFEIPFMMTDRVEEEEHTVTKRVQCGTVEPAAARILVAEDHPANQLLVKKLLQRFGIKHFEIAENGAIAVKHYKESDWDVILMDCHMPEMNGYEAATAIRAEGRETNRYTPIIAMTANAMAADREKCLSVGMDDYLSKPIHMDELLSALGQWLRFSAEEEELEDAPKAVLKEPAGGILDLTDLRSFTEGDPATEREFIGALITQSDKNLATLKEHSNCKATTVWREAAHMFKGGAASIGAASLKELCDKAQHFPEDTEETTHALFGEIDAAYVKVKEALREQGLL